MNKIICTTGKKIQLMKMKSTVKTTIFYLKEKRNFLICVGKVDSVSDYFIDYKQTQ